MIGLKWLVVGALTVASGSTALATIFGSHHLELDFTKPDVAKQASWTKSTRLTLGAQGLVLDGPGPNTMEMSLTTEPLATGLSWRPARGVSIVAKLSPAPSAITLDNGQTSTPSPGQLFARYSPDAKHWSSWQVLATTSDATGYTFKGQLAVTQRDSAAYDDLVSKYSTLDTPWASDEEAVVHWIVKAQPRFFEQNIPFIGYVQFLYEARLYGGQRLEHLDVDVIFDVGGIQIPPKDPKTAEQRDGPWRYRAK